MFACLTSGSALAVNWDAIPPKTVTLFYPGQSSWEWLLTADDHSGSKRIRTGKRCIQCHEGEESEIGTKMLAASRAKLAVLNNKPASLDSSIKMSYDAELFYIQISWKDGKTDGSDKIDKDYASRVTVMFDDGNVTEAGRAGCWGTCHDDAIDMPSADSDTEITKYLARSRTKLSRSGGGEHFKPTEELSELIQQGMFMEYWQARLNPAQSPEVIDGYILDKRHRNQDSMVTANAQLANGVWTVQLSRKRITGDPRHKDIVPGQTYSFGFAIHDDYANHRHHFVSFRRSVVLDEGEANFVVQSH